MRFPIVLIAWLTLSKILVGSDYEMIYSSYFGGEYFEQARDIAVDLEGNIYVTGGTSSYSFPVTDNAYEKMYKDQSTSLVGSWGPMMVFVAKFSPFGELLWSTYLGGPNYDRAYGIEVDSEGFVYVGGRAGEGFPTTSGSLQPNFAVQGQKNNLYGHQNGFITKLTPDGSSIVWSTYYGSDSFGFFRDIDVDDQGAVYGVLNAVLSTPSGIDSDAAISQRPGWFDMVVVKIVPDGSAVEWATFLGGSGEDRGGPSIKVGNDKTVYVGGSTKSTDFPTTSEAFQRENKGGSDVFITRIADDGKSFIYSSYYGGSLNESSETHGINVDIHGNVYYACASHSSDIPMLASSYQGIKPSDKSDIVLFKMNSDGSKLVGSTYFGGADSDYPEGIYLHNGGDVSVAGGTRSIDIPVTSSLHNTNAGGSDGIIARFNADLTELVFSGYFGGSGDESIRAFNGHGGYLYTGGQTSSTDLVTSPTAIQSQHASPNNKEDVFLTVFSENASSIQQTLHNKLLAYPSATNGSLNILLPIEGVAFNVEVYDIKGRLYHKTKTNKQLQIALPKNSYLIRFSRKGFVHVQKVIVN